jgi:hypothetical protein
VESERSNPAASLSQIGGARADLSQRLAAPWWFHVFLGVLVAQHALVQGFDNRNWTLPSFLLLIGGSAALVVAGRRATGVSVATPRGPRSRALMGIRVLAAAVGIWTAALGDDLGVAVAAAIVLLSASILLGRRYDNALRRDIAETLST